MNQHKKIGIGIAAIVVVIAAILVFMSTSVNSATKNGRILSNVFVDSVNVGGMAKEEAEDALEDYLNTVEEKKIELKADQKTKTIAVKDMGIDFQEEKAVKEAYGVGREGNIVSRYFAVRKLKKEAHVVKLQASITEAQAEKILKNNEKALIVKTQNASLTRKNGKFKIIDEVEGKTIVYDKSVSTMQNAIADQWDKDNFAIKISVKKEEPKYKAEDLKEVTDVLGTYATSYGSSGYSRCRNVENGCSKINGTTLYPGETLSVYKKVSPFDAENGYYKAGSYSGGEVVQTYGGGICQVSTTLYNAVLRSELKVTERSNHSMVVNYVPLSADAAIAGTHKDFKFKNNTKTPIYIEGETSGGMIRFTIYGKETRAKNRTIEFESKTISVSSPGKDIETKDPTLEEGKRIVTQSAHTGYTAELWKVIYIDGKEKERIKVNSSHYNSSPQRVRVGTKKKEEEKKTTEEKDKKDKNEQQGTTEQKTTEATTAATTATQSNKNDNDTEE